MDWERRCIRLCAGVLVLSALLRLTDGGFFAPVGRMLREPEAVSFFLFLHTGRMVRMVPGVEETSPVPSVPEQLPEKQNIPTFSP